MTLTGFELRNLSGIWTQWLVPTATRKLIDTVGYRTQGLTSTLSDGDSIKQDWRWRVLNSGTKFSLSRDSNPVTCSNCNSKIDRHTVGYRTQRPLLAPLINLNSRKMLDILGIRTQGLGWGSNPVTLFNYNSNIDGYWWGLNSGPYLRPCSTWTQEKF